MTKQQFAQLALLARMRGSKAQEAARLVLCEGLKQTEAAAKVGINQPTVSQAIRRLRLAQAQAFRVNRA
jgi:predicted DNA-binding protein (UPF0251 family)